MFFMSPHTHTHTHTHTTCIHSIKIGGIFKNKVLGHFVCHISLNGHSLQAPPESPHHFNSRKGPKKLA